MICGTASRPPPSCAGTGPAGSGASLPILSASLGHVHVADTQWYLEASPALMRAAMRRLERRWEARP